MFRYWKMSCALRLFTHVSNVAKVGRDHGHEGQGQKCDESHIDKTHSAQISPHVRSSQVKGRLSRKHRN